MATKIPAVLDDKKFLDSVQRGLDKAKKRAASTANKIKLNLDDKGFRQPLGRITGDLKMFDSALAASNARVIAFGASTAVIGSISKAFKDLARTTMEVEKAFKDVNRILNLSSSQFETFGNQLFQIGQKNAAAFQDLTKASLEFARQGLGTEEVLKRTSDALTLVRLTGINAEKAVSSLTATVNAFDGTMLSTTEALNKFVAVETQFAVGARDLVEALGRVGSSAQDAKVGFDELNAIVTSVQQTTGRGGAVIGNAMKTIFTRLQRQDTLDALESFGVAVRDVEGSTLPAIRILNNFAGAYAGLADSSQAYLREQVAGVFQGNILSAILKDLNKQQSTFSKALDTSRTATDQANQATAELNKSLSALVSQTGLEFQRLQENIGKTTVEPIAKNILGNLKNLLGGLNDLIDGEGTGSEIANGVLRGLGNVLSGPGLIAAVALIGKIFLSTTGYILKALPTLAGITTETQKRATIEQFIEQAMSRQDDIAMSLAGHEGDVATQASIISKLAEDTAQDLERQRTAVTAIAREMMKINPQSYSMVTGGTKGGRAAGGFIPGVAGEVSDIRRGVGGVSASAKPVAIPNFAFGGGVRGTMVANTGEYIVPNFSNGGSAIFNPNMIAQYGMPKGARPIRGARGYVPNFVDANKIDINKFSGKQFRYLSSQERTDLSGALGISVSQLQKRTPTGAIADFNKREAAAEAKKANMFQAQNFAAMLIPQVGYRDERVYPFRSADKIKKYGTEGVVFERLGVSPDGPNKMSGLVNIEAVLAKSVTEAANVVLSSIHPEFVDNYPVSEPELEAFMKKEGAPGAIASLKGAFFEALIGRMVHDKNKTPDGNTLDTVMSGPVKNLFMKSMRGNPRFADFKGGISEGNDSKFVDQVLNNFKGNAARGYIPNFAALGDAVEREVAAGVPLSAIRVNRSSRFVSPNNPAGLAVTNRRDEPNGLADVMRSAGGYVPNFAERTGLITGGSGGRLGGRKLEAATEALKNKMMSLMDEYADMELTTGQLNQIIKRRVLEEQKHIAALKNVVIDEKLLEQEIQKETIEYKQSRPGTGGPGGSGPGGSGPGGSGSGGTPRQGFFGRVGTKISNFNNSRFGGMSSSGLAMATPMIGGMLAESGIASRNAEAAMTGVGAGAAIGGMLGPVGGIVGSVVGGLAGLYMESLKVGDSFEEVAKAADDYAKETKATTSAAEEYIKAIEDINSGGTQQQLEDAQKRLKENFDKIKGTELEKSFSQAGTNVSAMTAELQKYEKQRLKEQILLNAGKRAAAFGEAGLTGIYQQSYRSYTAAGPGAQPQAGNVLKRDVTAFGEKDLEKFIREFGDLFSLIGNVSQEQAQRISAAARVGTNAGIAETLTKVFIDEFDALREEDRDTLTNFFGGFANQGMIREVFGGVLQQDLFGGGPNTYVGGFIDFFEKLNKLSETADIPASVTKKLEEGLDASESFIDVISGINEMVRRIGNAADSAARLKKVRSASSEMLLSTLEPAGLGLATGRIQQTAIRQDFQSQRQLFDADIQTKNAARIAKTIRDNQGAIGDDALRKLEAASKLFGQDVAAGLQAFKQFKAVSKDQNEVINKMIEDLSQQYEFGLENLRLEEMILIEKSKLEQTRRENTEKERIINMQMSAALDKRAKAAMIEENNTKKSIIRMRSRLEDPETMRGLTTTEQIQTRQAIEKRIENEEFGLRRKQLNEENIAKASEILVQREIVDSNLLLVKENSALQEAMAHLEFAINKAALPKPRLTQQEASDMGYFDVEQAMASNDLRVLEKKQEYDDKLAGLEKRRDAAISRSGSIVSDPATFQKARERATQIVNQLGSIETKEKQLAYLSEEKVKAAEANNTALESQIQAVQQQVQNSNTALTNEQGQAALDRKLSDERELRADARAKSFKDSFADGLQVMYEDTDYLMGRLGKQLPMTFRDNMVSAMEAVLDKTDSFEDAIKGVAIEMLRTIRRATLEASMNNFMMAIGMGTSKQFRNSGKKQLGGLIAAQNGMYVPGSRSGDRNLALLEDGEYVLNKKAVQGMGGKAALDQLKFGMMPRFNSGGAFGLAESVDSSKMSGLFLTSDSPELQEARDKAREEYEKKMQKKAEKDALKKQLVSTLISSAVSMGMSSLSAGIQGRFEQRAAMGQIETATAGSAQPLTREGNFLTGYKLTGGEGVNVDQRLQQLSAMKTFTPQMASNLGLQNEFETGTAAKVPRTFKKAVNKVIDDRIGKIEKQYDMSFGENARKGYKQTDFIRFHSPEANFFRSIESGKKAPGKINGGFISSGFGNIDSVPAFLAGGEYVMNSKAVRKYGLGFMGRLNGGLIPAMQAGGAVGAAGTAPISNQTASNTNNISININTGGSGAGSGESAEGNANANDQSTSDSDATGQSLAQKIKSVVMDVITEEQRLGGSLARDKRKAT